MPSAAGPLPNSDGCHWQAAPKVVLLHETQVAASQCRTQLDSHWLAATWISLGWIIFYGGLPVPPDRVPSTEYRVLGTAYFFPLIRQTQTRYCKTTREKS